MSKPFFSIIIPVYNEEGNVFELYERLTKVLKTLNKSYEIIFVDDGSKDTSFELMSRLHGQHSSVIAIKFSRNFGHHIAITAGLDYCKGEAVILMDADLQDQPEEIPKLYKVFKEGYDVVYGIRKAKKHHFTKRVISYLFIKGMNRIIKSDTPITSNIFRIMNRKVADTLEKFRERERFIVGIISYMGFKQVGVEVSHGRRFTGETKYSWPQMVKLGLNTLTSFTYKPLQLSAFFGIISICISFIGLIIILVRRLILNNIAGAGWISIMVAIFFIGGIQLICIGLIGEYIGRIYGEAQNRPLYIIDQILE